MVNKQLTVTNDFGASAIQTLSEALSGGYMYAALVPANVSYSFDWQTTNYALLRHFSGVVLSMLPYDFVTLQVSTDMGADNIVPHALSSLVFNETEQMLTTVVHGPQAGSTGSPFDSCLLYTSPSPRDRG